MRYHIGMSLRNHPSIAITSDAEPQEWARLEREIINKLNDAAP